VRTEVLSLAVGLALGVLGGLLIVRSRARGWMSDTWAQLATVALALVCFELGERLHGSGFVTAFAGGLAYSMMMRRAGAQMPSQVTDAAGQLLELIVFAMFGSYAVFVGWRDADWRVVLFAAIALIVVRLVAVSTALIGSNLPARSRLFIGWFGLGGVAAVTCRCLLGPRALHAHGRGEAMNDKTGSSDGLADRTRVLRTDADRDNSAGVVDYSLVAALIAQDRGCSFWGFFFATPDPATSPGTHSGGRGRRLPSAHASYFGMGDRRPRSKRPEAVVRRRGRSESAPRSASATGLSWKM
jgi:hypothetical protein